MNRQLLFKRIFAALLLAAVMLTSAACGTGENTDVKMQETSSAVSEETTAELTQPEIRPDIPEDYDLGGITLNVLNGAYFEGDEFMLDVQEAAGDVVSDAVYERNLAVSQALNVEYKFINKVFDKGEDLAAPITKSVLAGSKDYDLIFGIQYNVVPLVVKDMFMNLHDAPYIDIKKPWWSEYYINEVGIGNTSRYFLSGDITLGLLRHQSCAYFNKTLYESLFGSPENMYKEVLDGKWTHESLNKYAAASYSDINGDAKSNDEDRYGCGVIASNLTDHFSYDAGVRVTTRDENGIPQLTMNNEHTITFTEMMYNLYYNNPGVRVFPPDYISLHEKIPNKFMNEEVVFMFGWFYLADYLRDMQTDYGIIPFPKYDENQENYLSLIHDVATLVCVPATCDKLDAVCAVTEMMAYEGYKKVTPAYYEIALKTKYVRDSDDTALKIVDMIHDSATTDFAFVYNYALNGIGLIERDLMGAKKSDFASAYAKKEAQVLKKLDELVGVYTAME